MVGKKGQMVDISIGGIVKKLRSNLWIVSTAVLVVVIILMLIFGSGSSSGIGAKKAADGLVKFINAQGSETATLVSTDKEGELYKVSLSIGGQAVDAYVTLDGKYGLDAQSLVPLDGSASSTVQ